MNPFDPHFPHTFELFAPSHVVVMLVFAVSWVVLPLVFKRVKSERADVLFRHGMAILLVVQWLGFMLWEAVTGRFTVQLSLPFNLCDTSNFLCAVLLVTRSYALYEVLYFWAIAGAIQSFITPNITFAYPHLEFFVFYIQHGGMILCILYLTVVSGMRPQPKSMVKSFLFLVGLLVVIYVFNLATGSNYMFMMADTPQESTVSKMIRLFGQPPRHLIGLGMVVVASVLVLYSPFAIMDWARKIRGPRNEGS